MQDIPTPKRTLIEDRLGQPITDLIADLRADERSWRWIARYVSETTGVRVSHVALLRYAKGDAA